MVLGSCQQVSGVFLSSPTDMLVTAWRGHVMLRLCQTMSPAAQMQHQLASVSGVVVVVIVTHDIVKVITATAYIFTVIVAY